MYCRGCKKTHKDSNWRSTYDDSLKKIISVCSLYFKPSSYEAIPQSVKDERNANAKSMIQPWRQGEASQEFIEAYPKQASKMFTLKERMKAKPVWKDILPTNWQKTK